MNIKDKALLVIEYISVHDRGEDMFKIYQIAHIANGTCKNMHEGWIRMLDDYYANMIATGEHMPHEE